MQPYIFPYIGYFQLINAVDKFVFYDDVNFIKRGWINRNQLLVTDNPFLFSIPLKEASQNKLINQVQIEYDVKWIRKLYLTIENNYKKAPFFDGVYNLIQQVFEANHITIADLCIDSIKQVVNYLELEVVFEKSSEKYQETKGLEKAERIIKICQINQAKTYINPIGGKELYQKETFKENGIDLNFIESQLTSYPQFNNNFVPGLSIIDVLMFNNQKDVKEMLNHYQLV